MYTKGKAGFFLRLTLVLHVLLLYGQVCASTPDFYVFVEQGRQGVKNHENEVVIPPVYEQVGWSDSGFEVHENVIGYRENGKWGLLSMDNKKITAPVFEGLSVNGSSIYIVAFRKDRLSGRSLAGLIDIQGNQVISASYTRLEVQNERVIAHFPSRNNYNLVGLMDMKERVLIPFEYQNIRKVAPLRYLGQGNDGKGFLFDDLGQSVAAFTLDSLADFERDYARIWRGQFVGLIDRNGNIVVEPRFKAVRVVAGDIETIEYDKWRELDADNRVISEYGYDLVFRISDSLLKVVANGRTWLINSDSEIVSEIFDWIGDFDHGLAVVSKGGRQGVINTSGKYVVRPLARDIRRDGEFFYVSDTQDRWRILDRHGVEKTRGYYDQILDYQKLHFRVRKGNFWGIITRTGDAALNCVFDSVSAIREAMVSVRFKGLYGIADLAGNWVVLPDIAPKTIINDKLYMERSQGQLRVRTFQGDMVYFTENPLEVYNGYFIERLSNGKVWKINFSGSIESREVEDVIHASPVVFSEFEDIYTPSEGFTGIRKDGKYGFVDDQNRLRIANRYDSIKSFHEGFAAIKLLGRWGFIDKSENIRIQPTFDWVDMFSDGICVVRRDAKYYLIDREGRMPFTSGFDDMELLETDRYKVRRGNQYGLLSRSGEMIINFIYDDIEDVGDGSVIIRKSGKYGVLGLDGLNLVPRHYDDLVYDPELGHFLGKLTSEWNTLRLP